MMAGVATDMPHQNQLVQPRLLFLSLPMHCCALQPPPHSQDPNWYAIRYHDMRRNEYLRYFRGHTAPLNTLAMSPTNDMFMSASQVGAAKQAHS